MSGQPMTPRVVAANAGALNEADTRAKMMGTRRAMRRGMARSAGDGRGRVLVVA